MVIKMIKKYLSNYPYFLAILLSISYIIFGIYYADTWYSHDRSTVLTGAIFSLWGITCLITTISFHKSIGEISSLPKLRLLFSHPFLISGISLSAGIIVCMCLKYLISIDYTNLSQLESVVFLTIIIADLTALIYSLWSFDYFEKIIVKSCGRLILSS